MQKGGKGVKSGSWKQRKPKSPVSISKVFLESPPLQIQLHRRQVYLSLGRIQASSSNVLEVEQEDQSSERPGQTPKDDSRHDAASVTEYDVEDAAKYVTHNVIHTHDIGLLEFHAATGKVNVKIMKLGSNVFPER